MMGKIIKMPPRRRGFPKGVGPEIEQFRKIAADSAEHAVLANGPVSPDADLLDLCAEALHLLTHAERALEEGRAILKRDAEECSRTGDWHRPHPPGIKRAFDEFDDGKQKAKGLLRRIRKLRAQTAAGIYAKALVVRCSATGAPILAMSLAEDLIACPGLRASLWPAETEPTA